MKSKVGTCEICGGVCHRRDVACLDCACWLARLIEGTVANAVTLPLGLEGYNAFESEQNVIAWFGTKYEAVLFGR